MSDRSFRPYGIFRILTLDASRRRAAYRSEITSAICDLRRRGITPSRLRVFAAMRRSSMRHSPIVDQQIAASLREVEAPPGNIACGKCQQSPPAGQEPSDGRADLNASTGQKGHRMGGVTKCRKIESS